MAKNVKLLLIENVDDLGIVGDVVNVRTGFARNFLLPRNLATQPDEALIKQLAGKRAAAEKLMADRRKDREALSGKLQGVEVEMVRACNDMGILYGAVTQQDIAAALGKAGHKVAPRDVRITGAIKRVDTFDIHIKLDSDLDSVVKLHVKPDRELLKDTQGEAASAAPAGAGGEGGPRRRDALSQAIEAANQQTVTGWSKREGASDAGEAKPADKKAKGEKKSEGKKEAKADGEAKAEKADKAEKKPAKEKAEKPAKK
ncbi:MAG: 50S ribosomal protein L9 [Phycisphaerales bacterium]